MPIDQPRVSVGLTVYNGDNFLAEALDALLAQTYPDFEIIISDNASTDGTPVICQAYATRDARIRYERNTTNIGSAQNDNRVFSLARGEYFRWAAHDDICQPRLLEACITVLDQNPTVVLCYPRTRIIDEQGQFVEDYTDDFDLRSARPSERFSHIVGARGLLNPIYGVIRADVLRTTQLMKAYTASDRVVLGELALRGRFYQVPEYLFYRRVHPNKSTVANKSDQAFAAWFNPTKRRLFPFPRWRRFVDFLACIARAPVPVSEKTRCLAAFALFYISPGRLGGVARDFSSAVRTLRS